MGRVIDYTESSEFYEDDYLLVDNPTIGTKKVRANNVIYRPIALDTTFTHTGEAAEAAAVGSALEAIDDRLDAVEVTDVTLTHEGQAADAKAVGDAIDGIAEDVVETLEEEIMRYPKDTDNHVILPTSDKMLIVKSDGKTNYGDIPEGDVKKSLLMDIFSEDDSKTKVTITINTSGAPITGEVQSLRSTMELLKGNGTVGIINMHSSTNLWYVGTGTTLIMPVTPGHTYKFVPKTPIAEDGWYPVANAFFAPGFDFDFVTPYAYIPNTEGSIELVPEEHTTDGTGKIFRGSGIIVPEGMNYLLLGVVQTTSDSEQPDTVRVFEVYDYTLWPTDATYDKIVEDPVIGDTYHITYALSSATSSNNATSVGGSAQYKTVITANTDKIISSCSVRIGTQIYTVEDSEIVINNSASNIKIMAMAEALPDNTYVGAYSIKRELIPEDLLSEKLDTPTGLKQAEENLILYTNGSGGLVLKDPPYVPNKKFSTKWVPVYSHFEAGRYYDPSDDYTYKQIPESDTIWGNSLRLTCSSTSFDNLIPVEQGQRYRYQMAAIRLDRISSYLPGFIIFDANKEVLEVIEVESTQGGTIYPEFVIPKGGAWMAIHHYNAQTYIVQKEDVKTFDEFDLLSAINANYRSYLRGNNPTRNTLDKGYIVVGTDDLRPHQTKSLHELFTSNSIPYYMASIPERVKVCIQDDPYKSNEYYMNECLRLGGEIVCHSDDWITPTNVTDFNVLYKYFCLNKKELEFYGFKTHGIFLAGGENAVNYPEPLMDAWAVYYFDFSDVFGYGFPYNWMNRRWLEYLGADTVADDIETAINNKRHVIFGTHEMGNGTNTEGNVERMIDTLSHYTRGVDYEFTTPYELYKKLMPDPESN